MRQGPTSSQQPPSCPRIPNWGRSVRPCGSGFWPSGATERNPSAGPQRCSGYSAPQLCVRPWSGPVSLRSVGACSRPANSSWRDTAGNASCQVRIPPSPRRPPTTTSASAAGISAIRPAPRGIPPRDGPGDRLASRPARSTESLRAFFRSSQRFLRSPRRSRDARGLRDRRLNPIPSEDLGSRERHDPSSQPAEGPVMGHDQHLAGQCDCR